MAFRYDAAEDHDAYVQRFGFATRPAAHASVEVGGQGVFVRRPRADRANAAALAPLEAVTGRWGLIPLFSVDGQDRRTHVAPSETAAAERNFLQPWKRGHRCVVLASALFVRTPRGGTLQLTRANAQPFCIAGLWNGWRSPEGACVESFAMLTTATHDGTHLKHTPDDRPHRLPVVLPDAWVDEWFHAPVAETAAFLRAHRSQTLVTKQVPQAA